MHTAQIELSSQEREIIEQVQAKYGFDSIEDTIEWLFRQQLKYSLLKIAGREISRKQRLGNKSQ